MNEEKQFKLYAELMTMALLEPNVIYDTCIRVLVTMSKLNDDSLEEFKKVLTHMEVLYDTLGDYDELLKKALSKEGIEL